MTAKQLTRIEDIINEIRSKSVDGDYIYRGESKEHLKISSSLYREFAKRKREGFNLTEAQNEMLEIAKSHIGESPVGPLEDFMDVARRIGYAEKYRGETATETLAIVPISKTIAGTADLQLLTELQHYGGKTNLIDFTTDYLIAIYFACSGPHPEKDGRVILLEKSAEIENMIVCPRNPRHRVIAQKSMFIQPPQGYIEVPEDDIVYIPEDLKQPALKYLEKFHDISSKSIYNDIHGFITYQRSHQSAYIEGYISQTFQKKRDETKALREKQGKLTEELEKYAGESPEEELEKLREKQGKLTEELEKYAGNIPEEELLYEKAMEHYNNAIKLNPDLAKMLSIPSQKPNDSWTVERFKEELFNSGWHNHYESLNQTEKICQFGVDLMNLVESERWQLTRKFNKNYFAFLFRGRRVFGIRLGGNEFALRVWLPADILAEQKNEQYTYIYREWGKFGEYPAHVTVTDIKDVLEFAYDWYARFIMSR